VTTALSVRHPEHLIGIHLNMVFAFPDPESADELTERERDVPLMAAQAAAPDASARPAGSAEATA
jgi:hypothetical protein